MRRALLAGALSLLVIVGVPSAATASPSAAVTLVGTSNLDPSVTPTWSATGGFEDSGISIPESFIVTGFENPGMVTVHASDTYLGDDGTFNSRLQDRAVSLDGPFLTLEGHWVITPGTGDYSTLHGQGTSVTTVNFITGEVVVTMSGQVHFD